MKIISTVNGLVNAQGEDVVAGIRTPNPINEVGKNEHNNHLDSLETAMPEVYKKLHKIELNLEKHYHDMLDLEFTIQEGTLYMLQCRIGKRNGAAAVKMAADMYKEKFINAEEAVMRVKPEQLDELLHPVLLPAAEKAAQLLTKGLPAGPGGATGQVVFTANDAVEWKKAGKRCNLSQRRNQP